VSTASATISSVALTAEQINDGVFDSIIETATFLQEVSSLDTFHHLIT